jgi:hypothetical protein
MPVLKSRGQKGPLQFENYWNRAVQNMGQPCCHTKLPPASRLTRINARCSRTSHRTIKRFARTDARSVCCPCRKSCSGGRSSVSKTKKREVRHAKQDSDRPGVAATSAGSFEQASPTIDWIAPHARNFRCHPDAGAAVRGHLNVCGRSRLSKAAAMPRPMRRSCGVSQICGGSSFSVVELSNKTGGTNG